MGSASHKNTESVRVETGTERLLVTTHKSENIDNLAVTSEPITSLIISWSDVSMTDRNENRGDAGLLILGGKNAGRGHDCSDGDGLVAIIGGFVYDPRSSAMRMGRSNGLKRIKNNEDNPIFRVLTLISMLLSFCVCVFFIADM